MELFLVAVVAVVVASINTPGPELVFGLAQAVVQVAGKVAVQVTLAYLLQAARVVLLAMLVVLDHNIIRDITQRVKAAKLVVAAVLARTMVEDSLPVVAVAVAVVFLAALAVRVQLQDGMAQLAVLVVRARERAVRQVVPVTPLQLEPVAVAALAQRAA
jgi:hypothetical protein